MQGMNTAPAAEAEAGVGHLPVQQQQQQQHCVKAAGTACISSTAAEEIAPNRENTVGQAGAEAEAGAGSGEEAAAGHRQLHCAGAAGIVGTGVLELLLMLAYITSSGSDASNMEMQQTSSKAYSSECTTH
jgi:hypothetical protein